MFGNKQVCNFYLKGTCKYGTRCWNLHPDNPGGAGGNSFKFTGDGSSSYRHKTAAQDTKEFSEFVKQVSGEMTQWERSGQWLLSSFAPLKSGPVIPGFSDTSPEELRVQAYEALKTNTSQAYQTRWNELQQMFKQLREALKMSSPEATQALREVHQTKGPENHGGQQQPRSTSLFSVGNAPTQTIFGGGSSNTTGILGVKPQNSVFGGASSQFGQSSSSLFGGGTKSVFGGQATMGMQNTFESQQNTFGGGMESTANTSTPGSLFGGTSNQQSTASTLFGGNTSTNTAFGGQAQNNIFNRQASSTTPFGTSGGTSSNMFGGSGGGSLFGGQSTPTPTTQQSAFGATPSLFGGQQTQPSLFGKPASTAAPSVFGGATAAGQTTSLFGGASQTNTAGSGGASVFGGNSNPTTTGTTSLFGNNTPISNTSVFGGAPSMTTSTSSVFGGTPATPASSASIFAGATNTTATTSVFGGAPGQTSSLFGGNSAAGLFGNPGSVAPNQEKTSLLGGQNPAPGLFGNPPAGQTTGNSLLPTPPANQMLFGGTAGVKATEGEWYTPLDQLKQDDRNEFEANSFTRLPLCAPPLELCF